jgi:hypothetical protein
MRITLVQIIESGKGRKEVGIAVESLKWWHDDGDHGYVTFIDSTNMDVVENKAEIDRKIAEEEKRLA